MKAVSVSLRQRREDEAEERKEAVEVKEGEELILYQISRCEY